MIKLNNILQDTLLYEGLIYTHDIDTTIHHLERWSISNTKFIIKKTTLNTIQINFGQQPSDKEIDNLLKWINNLGWFIADYLVNSIPLRRKSFVNQNEFKDDVKKHKLLNILLEAKYDLELNKYELCSKTWYHITPLSNKNKVDKIGLIPKSLSKISNHPERIYLTNSEADAIGVAELFDKLKGTDFVLYKIDIDGLIKHNNGIRFFKDPNLGSGIYTLSNIPNKFLKFIKIINFK